MKTVRVRVKKDFLDRYTGTKRKVGDEFAITDSRYREIKRSGDYVELLKDTPAKEKK